MTQTIRVDELSDAIVDTLMEYQKITYDELEKIAKEVAREGSKKLKEVSPRGSGSRKGHYADGWKVTAVRVSANKFSFVINNKKKPGLTHLLEEGHQLRQGGRVPAIVHVAPVEQWCIEEYEKRVKEMLG